MINKLLMIITVAFIAAVIAVAAHAQTPQELIGKCGYTEVFHQNLRELNAYSTFIGQSFIGTLIEIWVDPEGGFVVFETSAEGISCIRAIGQSISH